MRRKQKNCVHLWLSTDLTDAYDHTFETERAYKKRIFFQQKILRIV